MGAKVWEGLADDALRAFGAWKDTPRMRRRSLLEAWLEQVALMREELAQGITAETGKPITLARG